LAAAAEHASSTPIPELPAALYATFHATGDRDAFEALYFARRNRLAHLALTALLAPDPSPWLTALWLHWQALLDEPAWALPAHTFVPSGLDPDLIELFTAETMNLCGELLDLFAAIAPPALAAAEHARSTPIPELPAALYATFHATGDRDAFEALYFARRNRLAYLALSALLALDPTHWLPALWLHWQAVLDEPAWAFPAHTFVPSGLDPDLIELFAAETMNLCGELLDLFAASAPPALVAATRARLSHLFDVYLGDYGERRWGWFQSANNWNAVCHQGVVGAALATEPDPARLAEILLRAAKNLPAFLAGFTADGGCSEGPGYWAYGFGRFAWLNEQLEHRTAGAFTLLGDHPAALAIVPFGARLSLHAAGLVNFSDNQPVGLIDPALLAYLATRAADPACATVSTAHYVLLLRPRAPDETFPSSIHHVAAPGGPNLEARRLDVFHYTRFLRFAPTFSPPSSSLLAPRSLPPSSFLYPELGVTVLNGTDASGLPWSLAVKGGHNDEHHNHNDVGSFVFRHAGLTWASEIGTPQYTKDYFHGDRYRHLAARSLG
ncbi:MAG: heparinase II/III family protein, partial [Burkholderiales bacterium]|nr:heparinase II/III family protein [Opitutaceae bacterium]